MKRIGLLGGMSWESSMEYYRIINQKIKEVLGGLHSANLIMLSLDFHEIEILQHSNKWKELISILNQAAKDLENADAELVLICTNTMHKIADEVQRNISIPLLHIADQTAKKIMELKLKKIGLLGTKITMEEDFYKGRLIDNYGLEIITPNDEDMEIINRIIYEELVVGKFRTNSKQQYINIINKMISNGVEGIILGCTEIPLLIKDADIEIPIFDTTKIHAESAVYEALK
jgi:aspartate racemase